ncbi:MAG TPA: long-chain fatty acid--CoA ligase [Terrimicrobiaceae bacterium]
MNSWLVSVETIARNLYQRGLAGRNVLISLPRSFEFIGAFLGCLRAGAVALPLDFPSSEIALEITSRNIGSLLQANAGPLPPQPPPEAPAAIFFTSGSTGVPKGIVHSHRSIWAMADNLADCADLTAADRFLVTEDLTNASGITHVTACLATGATVFLGNGIDDIKKLSPTVLMIMGKLNHDIVNSPSVSRADFASVRVNVTGGSKITPELIYAFKEKTGVPLRVGYGMSEILCITINKSESRDKLASIGKPTKDVEVRLVDDEVCVQGPNLMSGYWREAPQSGWFRTGDLASCDADGFYWFKGRKKLLIVREGYNVSPIWIEEVLLSHPAIDQAAVIGQPDPAEGEVPVAFVTLKRAVAEKAIQDFLRPVLKPWEMPIKIMVLEQMPFIQGRKVDRQALKKYLA